MPRTKRPPPSPIVAPGEAAAEAPVAEVTEVNNHVVEGGEEPPTKVARFGEAQRQQQQNEEVEEDVNAPTPLDDAPTPNNLPPLSHIKTDTDQNPTAETPMVEGGGVSVEVAAAAAAGAEDEVSPVKTNPDLLAYEGVESLPAAEPVVEGGGEVSAEVAAAAAAAAASGTETGEEGLNLKTEELPEDEKLDDETANRVIDMAVDAVDRVAAAAKAAEATEQDGEVVVEANVAGDAADEPMADAVEVPTTTAVKKVVVLDAEHGNVIKETIIEAPPESPSKQPQAVKKAKKERKEFTAQEKLQILSELEGPNPPSVQSLLYKYGVSKSSLHRWRQPDKMERLQQMVAGETLIGPDGTPVSDDTNLIANRDKLKKRDMADKLRKIKMGLQAFCKANLACPENEQLAITSSLIQLKASEIKDDLLKRYESTEPNLLTHDEVTALEAFKGSKSWACLIGNQLGYLNAPTGPTGSDTGPMVWSEVAKANTATYLEHHSRKPPKAKKQRMEFTAQEKLLILKELEDTNKNRADGTPPLTVEEICQKYHTSKSSLHRWKQQYRSGRLQQLAASGSGFANSKRIFNDKLNVIKKALNDFYVENENADLDKKVPINYTTLHARAIMAKDEILEKYCKRMEMKMMQAAEAAGTIVQHEQQMAVQPEPEPVVEPEQVVPKEEESAEQNAEGTEQGKEVMAVVVATEEVAQSVDKAEEVKIPPLPAPEEGAGDNSGGDGDGGNDDGISKEEVQALENFKASGSWLRETAKKFGWKLDVDSKRDGIVAMDGVIDTAVAAAAVYHHPVADQHHNLQHHHGIDDHPPPMVQPIVHHQYHPHHHQEVVQNSHDMTDAQHEQIVRQHHEFQEQQQEQQPPEEQHVDPNMAMYDTEMLQDPLVHMEGHNQNVVGGVVNEGDQTTVDI